jgi:hypothetical protein
MRRQGVPDQMCNEDEEKYERRGSGFEGRFIASFTKGLAHNQYGEVENPDHYCALLRALASGRPADFEAIPLGCSSGGAAPASPKRYNIQAELVDETSRQIKLVNPQAALAFDLLGIDSHQAEVFDWGRQQGSQIARVAFPPAPAFESAEEIAEIAENYWMALLRDVNFTQYEAAFPVLPPGVMDTPQQAADSLTKFVPFDFKGPVEGGRVTPRTLFRGITRGDKVGPYVSQFLLLPIPYGSQLIDSKIKTVAARDYMTSFPDWLDIQNGCRPAADKGNDCGTGEFRYIRNGRDLGQYVHVDTPYQAYYNAFHLLLGTSGEEGSLDCAVGGGFMTPLNNENIYKTSKTQQGFVTLGPAHIQALLGEVTSRALKAMWYQKWSVHRRLRPEAFAGRIHVSKRASAPRLYPFHAKAFAVLDADILPKIVKHNRRWNSQGDENSYLLPMAFAEGSPLHPAYGAGHSVIAGACVTILKAMFHGEATFAELKITPKVASEDGKSLVNYTGADADKLTIGEELDKLASNISIGRDIAGVHWRSDYTESIRLGEAIAVWLLCDQRRTFNEAFRTKLTTFDGHTIIISRDDVDCF